MTIITRREHLDRYNAAYRGEIDSTPPSEHVAYYDQFVTSQTLGCVERAFGAELLRESFEKDPNLNNIPLAHWDAITAIPVADNGCDRVCADHSPKRRPRSAASAREGRFRATLPINREAILAAGETLTRSVLVCIAKNAARTIADRAPAAAAA